MMQQKLTFTLLTGRTSEQGVGTLHIEKKTRNRVDVCLTGGKIVVSTKGYFRRRQYA